MTVRLPHLISSTIILSTSSLRKAIHPADTKRVWALTYEWASKPFKHKVKHFFEYLRGDMSRIDRRHWSASFHSCHFNESTCYSHRIRETSTALRGDRTLYSSPWTLPWAMRSSLTHWQHCKVRIGNTYVDFLGWKPLRALFIFVYSI